MLGCSFWNTTSAETKLRLRAMDLERAQNVQSALVGSHIGAPNCGCAGNVLSQEGGEGAGNSVQVWPRAWIECSLGQLAVRAESRSRCPGRCTSCRGRRRTSAGLRSVRGMRPGTSVSAVWSQISSGVNECVDCLVAAGGLAQGATGGVGGVRVQGAGLAGGTGYGFAGLGAPQAQADRINVLLGLSTDHVCGLSRHSQAWSTSTAPCSASRV